MNKLCKKKVDFIKQHLNNKIAKCITKCLKIRDNYVITQSFLLYLTNGSYVM